MLLQFHVENWCSFKDRATLDLSATNDENLPENVIKHRECRVLRSAAIYGANGSGKSNLLEAIFFMRRLVIAPKEAQIEEELDVEPFRLSAGSEERPTLFEIQFCENDHLYRYGFEVDRSKIHTEWLYLKTSSKESKLFLRKGQHITYNTSSFKEARDLDVKTKANRLFISVCEEFNGPVAAEIVGWLRRMRKISGLNDRAYYSFTSHAITKESFRSQVVDLMQRADMPFIDLKTERSKKGLRVEVREALSNHIRLLAENDIKTVHKFFNSDGKQEGTRIFDLNDFESEGSKKFVALCGPLVEALATGRVLLIDELEARLHPLLSRFIISLFSGAKSNAQLIFATHDTNLLSNQYFRRDQLWFTELDEYEASHLYSLAEFKVRSDASFGKDYILGKYGAIPFIGAGNLPQ